MGQSAKFNPGCTNRLNFPHDSITPTSEVLIVKKQGKHIFKDDQDQKKRKGFEGTMMSKIKDSTIKQHGLTCNMQ